MSPNLQVCQDLELAVPGSYAPGQPIVRIASFHESLEVFIWIIGQLIMFHLLIIIVKYAYQNF